MSQTKIELEIANKKESFSFNRVAAQANGSVWYTQGDAVLIATVVVDTKPVDEDFLPLMVQYIEKSYAAAKFPGGFIKRESKPSDFETLTGRIVDRSLRPLFPKGFNYPVTITVMVVSSDNRVDMQVAAVTAANAALMISGLGIDESVSAVRIGKIENAIITNPALDNQPNSDLDLLVVGKKDEIMMIEMRSLSKENISEDELGSLIETASETISNNCTQYEKSFANFKKELINLPLNNKEDSELLEYILANHTAQIKDAIEHMAKSERSDALDKLLILLQKSLSDSGVQKDSKELVVAISKCKTKIFRSMILDEQKRADGRKLSEVRNITIETNILPSVHGTCLFTRGQTQALATVTLGNSKDAQSYELITEKNSLSENFMVHYNFPGFSVGDTKPIGPTNRRELGHGNLAKRALEPTIKKDNSQTIRVVSEILESNGSSSMATVCGGSMALVAAGVELENLVAGVAMGLVCENDKYAVLTDIMGLEDFEGDMDFKIAGTINGVTAMQMDIKLDGVKPRILKEAIAESKLAKEHILSLMNEASTKIIASNATPKIVEFSVHPSKIVDVIGKGGSVIREIIETYEVSIDLDRDNGGVKLSGKDSAKLEAAKEHILELTNTPIKEAMQFEINKSYIGKVKKIVDFGIFVEMPDGFDALLHNSKMDKIKRDDWATKYTVGEEIEVIVMEQSGKKIDLATPEFIA